MTDAVNTETGEVIEVAANEYQDVVLKGLEVRFSQFMPSGDLKLVVEPTDAVHEGLESLGANRREPFVEHEDNTDKTFEIFVDSKVKVQGPLFGARRTYIARGSKIDMGTMIYGSGNIVVNSVKVVKAPQMENGGRGKKVGSLSF